MASLRVGLVQQRCTKLTAQNHTNSIAGIREAAAKGAELVLLQELYSHFYFCQVENALLWDLAEPVPGPATEMLGAIAKELSVVIVAPLFERRTAGIYHNTAVVFEKNGQIAGKYRKMHIPGDTGYYEKFYFTPGDLGFQPIHTSVGNLGVLICCDQWYPEAARLMTLHGADILLYPTSMGRDAHEKDMREYQQQYDSWLWVQRSHAVVNGIPVLVCNRVGFESAHLDEKEGVHFWGSSFVIGQQGELLAMASQEEPEVLVTEVNLERNEYVRRGRPFLRDRRIDAYKGLLSRYIQD